MSLSAKPSSYLIVLLLATTSVCALADPPRRAKADRPPANDALADSVRRVERSTRAQVLSAERIPYEGRNVNRIKIMDDRGRVRVYMDDPRAKGHKSTLTEAEGQPLRGSPTRRDDD